jgi:hypothetical protein
MPFLTMNVGRGPTHAGLPRSGARLRVSLVAARCRVFASPCDPGATRHSPGVKDAPARGHGSRTSNGQYLYGVGR